MAPVGEVIKGCKMLKKCVYAIVLLSSFQMVLSHGFENLRATNGVLFFLKNSTSSRFRVLVDIAVQDHPKNKERFLIVYNLLSLKYGTRLLLSTSIREGSVIPSCTHIFPGAN